MIFSPPTSTSSATANSSCLVLRLALTPLGLEIKTSVPTARRLFYIAHDSRNVETSAPRYQSQTHQPQPISCLQSSVRRNQASALVVHEDPDSWHRCSVSDSNSNILWNVSRSGRGPGLTPSQLEAAQNYSGVFWPSVYLYQEMKGRQDHQTSFPASPSTTLQEELGLSGGQNSSFTIIIKTLAAKGKDE